MGGCGIGAAEHTNIKLKGGGSGLLSGTCQSPEVVVSRAAINGILKIGRANRVENIKGSLLRDDTMVEKTARLRLQEWEIGYGTSRWDRRRGLSQRVANQCEIATISILGGRPS